MNMQMSGAVKSSYLTDRGSKSPALHPNYNFIFVAGQGKARPGKARQGKAS